MGSVAVDVRDIGALGSCAMDTAISLVELLVGLGCLAGAVVVFRTGGSRVAGVALLIAGAAAVGHAVTALA
jgi:hypothetical protein